VPLCALDIREWRWAEMGREGLYLPAIVTRITWVLPISPIACSVGLCRTDAKAGRHFCRTSRGLTGVLASGLPQA